MASLFSSYPVVLIEQWAYTSDLLSSNLRTSPTTEVVRQVLNLSYNNLTHYLKTCLLYLNMYPEGYTICKDDLVMQWVAEGFIDAAEGRDMERVAMSYFDELIDRRFLQLACIKYNNAMVSCTVHDTVHDLIAYKSVEENFVMVVDSYRKNVELLDKVHRLSIQFDDTENAKKPADIRSSQVRSLFFFGLFRCMPSIRDFKLLRLLNLQLSGHHGDDVVDLTGISELFHLRYLKVASDVCIELPKCRVSDTRKKEANGHKQLTRPTPRALAPSCPTLRAWAPSRPTPRVRAPSRPTPRAWALSRLTPQGRNLPRSTPRGRIPLA